MDILSKTVFKIDFKIIVSICMISATITAGRGACANQNPGDAFTPDKASAKASAKTFSTTFSSALISTLDHCLQKTEKTYINDPDFNFNIGQQCPTLSRLLATENLSTYLQQPLDKNVTIDQLMDLQSITTTIQTRHEAPHGFDLTGLQSILQNTFVPKQEQKLTLWKRFLNWLADFFEKNEPRQPNWLKDWLSGLSIPAWFVEAFYKGVVILLAILLAAVVIVEIRAAGISRWLKRRSRQLRLGGSRSSAAREVLLTWEAIYQLPAREKILASYKKLLHLLIAKNLLPGDSSLTNYELQSRLETTLGGEQAAFCQLVNAVETMLYGDKNPDNGTIEQITRGARQFADSINPRTGPG